MKSGKTPRCYSEEEKRLLREHILAGGSHADILAACNLIFKVPLTKEQLKSFISNNKFNTGRTGYFPKGHIPYNKGKRGPEYGYLPTCFKKGHTPAKQKPVGSTRINVDGYTEIKIAEPKKWRLLHQVVWEQANGPIPKGHAVIFGDGDKQNVKLNNLILVTRSELAVLNKFHLLGKSVELTRTGVLVADLIMKIRARKKHRKKTEDGEASG